MGGKDHKTPWRLGQQLTKELAAYLKEDLSGGIQRTTIQLNQVLPGIIRLPEREIVLVEAAQERPGTVL